MMPGKDRFWLDGWPAPSASHARGGTGRSTTGGRRRSISGVLPQISEAQRFGGAEPGQPAGSPKCRSNIIQDTLEAAPLFSDPHRRLALTGRLARSSSILRRECRREFGKGIGIGWVNKSLLKV